MRWVGDRGACRQERRRCTEPSGAHCCTWRERSVAIDCCAAGLCNLTEVAVAGLFASSANYATFFREHKPVRYTLNPIAPIVSMVGLLGHRDSRANAPLLDPAGKTQRTAAISSKTFP